jgi:hypothetical protein
MAIMPVDTAGAAPKATRGSAPSAAGVWPRRAAALGLLLAGALLGLLIGAISSGGDPPPPLPPPAPAGNAAAPAGGWGAASCSAADRAAVRDWFDAWGAQVGGWDAGLACEPSALPALPKSTEHHQRPRLSCDGALMEPSLPGGGPSVRAGARALRPGGAGVRVAAGNRRHLPARGRSTSNRELRMKQTSRVACEKMTSRPSCRFGTWEDYVEGQDALEARQWRSVWPTIEGFHHRTADSLQVTCSPDGPRGRGRRFLLRHHCGSSSRWCMSILSSESEGNPYRVALVCVAGRWSGRG